ncbi:MAG: apolipoprotein N-acyltransferase [Treponema sp.]|nr:apolipoprotein N-acyltransferase [Treponema sp.]
MKSLLINTAAILAGALLFAASFPNPVFSSGLPLLAWAAYAPVFFVIRRSGPGACALWGALYGYTAYRLLTPWLGAFHPMAGAAVSMLQLVYMALLFPLLKLALILYPQKGYLLQWLLWLAYEYLRTLGFLGFPYGITGYTQWQYPPVIGIASVFGVWGVSALVLFPSAYLGVLAEDRKNYLAFFRRERIAAAAWLGALGAALVFGTLQAGTADSTRGATAKIALIQQNADPWKTGAAGTRYTLKTLCSLSQKALEEAPGTELVVWPETAFVPRIYWHLTYRDNAESYGLVKELMDFLAAQRVPFLIGNDDARREVTSAGRWDRVDYNAALLFEGGELKTVYRKMHLVPLAEHFPYEKTFPRLYRALIKADTHFWKPGTEPVVFYSGGLKFSAPICFEDSFGPISRNFTRQGAEFIVNLTNDSWAESLSCQVQHLAMAVFRAVENRRSLVRAASSGQTCAIAPSGKILAMAPPFTETALNVEIPLSKSRTPYTFWGDFWGMLFALSAAILLICGALRFILETIKTGRKS